MNRAGILAVLLALAACSQSDPPPMAVVPPRKTVPAAAPAPKAPEPAPPEPPPPVPVEPSRPKPAEEPVRPPPAAPRRPFSNGKVHLPAFTFRPLDGGGKVLINGEELSSSLPCLWSITDDIEFDPRIPVPSWPPEGAFSVGSTSHPDTGSAELYLARSATLPHLQPNEAVLFVKGRVGERAIQGGLRLRVEGCRYVDYTPLVNPEGDGASRFLRTIWFDRIRND